MSASAPAMYTGECGRVGDGELHRARNRALGDERCTGWAANLECHSFNPPDLPWSLRAARTAQQIGVTPRPAERRRAPGHLAQGRRSARSGSTGRDLSLILGAWLSATHLPGTLPSLRVSAAKLGRRN